MIYEYLCTSLDKSCDHCKTIFEAIQPITAEPLSQCPECGNPITRQVSLCSGFVFKGRQANQYSDIKAAKYWRDNNGNRHKVTAADGSLNSPTVSSRITASPAEIAAKKRRDQAIAKKRRSADSYNRFQKRLGR